MAFGTWLKQTFNKVKDVAMNKVLPAVKKVAGFVGKAASPIMSAVGGVVGGPTGDMLSSAGSKLSKFMGGFEKSLPGSNGGGSNELPPHRGIQLRFK